MVDDITRKLAFVLAVFLPLGCEASSRTPTPGPELSVAGLTPYVGPLRSLFDDAIDPEVFSNSSEAAIGTTDRRILERIRSSNFAVTVNVVTVTDELASRTGVLELELMPVERPVYGDLSPFFQPSEPIKVNLNAASAGFALIRANQNELVGKRLNLCWGRFADGNSAVDHWHAFSDSPKTREAIKKAAAVADFD